MEGTTDWLGEALPAPPEVPAPVADDGWLEATTIEATRLPADAELIKFSCMRGSGRVWACNGYYVAYRPYNHVLDKTVNEATAARHQDFLDKGHYTYLGTFDEVQIFRLEDGSPFKRVDNSVIIGLNFVTDCRSAVKAALTGDWVLYVDILDHIASRIKSGFGDATKDGRAGFDAQSGKEKFMDIVAQIENSIAIRGGPNAATCEAQVNRIRNARGQGVQTRILTLSR